MILVILCTRGIISPILSGYTHPIFRVCSTPFYRKYAAIPPLGEYFFRVATTNPYYLQTIPIAIFIIFLIHVDDSISKEPLLHEVILLSLAALLLLCCLCGALCLCRRKARGVSSRPVESGQWTVIGAVDTVDDDEAKES